jgi:hypothetical protein
MTITSKDPGTCKKCHGHIAVGTQIEWSQGRGAQHVTCPGKTAAPPAQNQNNNDAPYTLGGGSGYGCDGWATGQTLTVDATRREKGWPEYVTVVRAGQQYFRADGLSFGVGDDAGYTYWANCREATREEIAAVAARIAQPQAVADAKKVVEDIARDIRGRGEYPEPWQAPAGERLIDTQDIGGGGSWFIVGPEGIWFVRNNGADGDDWAHNNVRTGGAGGIGWRVPFDVGIAAALQAAAKTINP